MSVQAGILCFDHGPANSEMLAQLSCAAAAFGPDGESPWIKGPLAMLYRPFHTSVESEHQQQPLVVANGNVFTWDGRLDNRDEHIKELGPCITPDSPDVVIVARAFDKWGPACFKKFVGEWAACVWNSREDELLLARDYIGVRQLYYTAQSHSMAWCSVLAALVECGDRFTVSDEYIAGYLARKPEAHLTPFSEIRSVPPGSFVRIRNRQITTHAFWNFDQCQRVVYKTDAEYEEHYRCLFRQAVRRRLRSNAPVLASLSGGLDSSSIVCMADHILSNDKAVQTRVDTVSYYDLTEPDEDDLDHLRKVEAKRGREGFHLELRGNGDSLAFQYSTLTASPGFTARREVRRGIEALIARGEHRVILSGIGGDEMNGQALNPLIPIAELIAHGQLVKAGRKLFDWSLLTRTPYLFCLMATLSELLPMTMRVWFSNFALRQPWINRQFAKQHRMAARELEDLHGVWCLRPGRRDALQTITTLSRELTRVTPSKLEHRYPYLDQDLVQFLTSIPFDQLLRGAQRRSLMRRALAGIVPSEILARQTKVSASRCYAVTVNEHWNEISESLASSVAARMGFIDSNILREQLGLLRNGQGAQIVATMLKALSLEFWLRDICARKSVKTQLRTPPTAIGRKLALQFATYPHKKGGNRHEGIPQT